MTTTELHSTGDDRRILAIPNCVGEDYPLWKDYGLVDDAIVLSRSVDDDKWREEKS